MSKRLLQGKTEILNFLTSTDLVNNSDDLAPNPKLTLWQIRKLRQYIYKESNLNYVLHVCADSVKLQRSVLLYKMDIKCVMIGFSYY